MCGIVGMAGNITSRGVTAFKELLVADEVRGRHSTGIARVETKDDQFNVYQNKLAIPASMYQYMPVHDLMTGHSPNLTVLLGHNRHATKGASDNSKFAHPFKHGKITLVHNGSLNSHHQLTKEFYTVDSEAICKAIDNEGVDAVIPKLNGAFALVWINEEEKTLNFIRNHQRPFAIAHDKKTKTIYWASESSMLEAYIGRSTSVFNDNSLHYDGVEELPVGELWTFDISEGVCDIEACTKTKMQLYVAPTYNHYNRNRSHSNYVNGNSALPARTNPAGKSHGTDIVATQTTTESTTNNKVSSITDSRDTSLDHVRALNCSRILDAEGRRFIGARNYIEQCDEKMTYLEDGLVFFLTDFQHYPKTTDYGSLRGRLAVYPYSKVIVHSVPSKLYQEIMEENLGLGYVFLTSLNLPMELRARLKISDDEMQSVEIVCNGTTLRPMELEDLDQHEINVQKAPHNYRFTSALEAYLEELEMDILLNSDDSKSEVYDNVIEGDGKK